MTTDNLAALAAAVAALPDDVALRLVYAEQLLANGRAGEAIEQAGHALQRDPGNTAAAGLISRAATPQAAAAPEPDTTDVGTPSEEPTIDWQRHEQEIGSPVAPPFVVVEQTETGVGIAASEHADPEMLLSRETMTLADVGGLGHVKRRINDAFLEPMRHPEIAKAFGTTLRGGLVLYGPPGCGKTFMARAIAGELGAHFISVTVSDILDKYLGESEANIHEVFVRARSLAPAVLFFDEIDAIGGKRSSRGWTGMRTIVNQLLIEMDGLDSANDGLFILGATNHPWDVDSALLRPGRFDRMILVEPPDAEAREAILHVHLRGKPVEGVDLRELVERTDGYSGADLEHICTTAGQKAMSASIAAGQVLPIGMKDLRAALKEVKPSIGGWVQSARNVAMHGNAGGQYDELVDYLRRTKQL